MVLEELVGIERKTMPVAVVVQPHHPAAQLVALYILVSRLAVISTAGKKCIPEIADTFPALQLFHASGTVRTIGRTAEERGHLQSHLQRPRAENLVISDFQITGLGMVEHPLGIL